jgi:teichuronic acid biosynthesis glycosyltransferase TuaH
MGSNGRVSRISLHALARSCFWALPAPIRSQLHGVRHFLACWFRNHHSKAVPRIGDLDWPGFRDLCLRKSEHRGVIIFEPNVDWDIPLFQRPHHMALALGRLGGLVIFRTMGDGVAGFRRVAENVWIANDPAVSTISGAVRCFYSTSLLANAADVRAASKHGWVVYEYIDHIDASISGGRSTLRRLHGLKRAAFDGAADVVVSSATALHEEALVQCREANCVCIPNGVDVRHYRDARHLLVELPESMAMFRGRYQRIVGYFGAIAPWLWYEVIEQVSDLMPNVGFVFIGPDYSGCVPRLPRRDNALYLGAVNYAVLPAYACLFDVCFIPFRPGDVARSTSPLKLYEYFALEKPVVVTADMNECVAFREVFAGRDAAELVEAINSAFEVCDHEEYQAKLRALADANSWGIRAGEYLAALEELDAK